MATKVPTSYKYQGYDVTPDWQKVNYSNPNGVAQTAFFNPKDTNQRFAIGGGGGGILGEVVNNTVQGLNPDMAKSLGFLNYTGRGYDFAGSQVEKGTAGNLDVGNFSEGGGISRGAYDQRIAKEEAGMAKQDAAAMAGNMANNPLQGGLQPKNGMLPYDQALANLQRDVKNPQDLARATAALQSRYQSTQSPAQQGYNNAMAMGMPPPQDPGTARSMVQKSMPPAAPNTANVELALSEDKGYQQLLKDRAEFTSVANQQGSLLETYDKLVKQAGIPALNTQLLNAKKIIDGTEDDIRREVQATGGLATDSQVMALASARNKTLIQNYNNLLDTKNMAMENVQTMIGLAKEDQQTALQNITQKMQIDQQILEYRDKFVNNAKEGLNNVLRAVGYAGLYQSLQGDPSSIPLVERTLGLAPGGLQQLANYVPPMSEMDQLDLQYKKGQIALQQSNLQTDALQRKKIQSDISSSGTIPGSGVDEKTLSKIQSSPEYKTINGVLPAIQALAAYKEAVNKYGTTEFLSGSGKGELQSTYGNAIAAWKTLAGLGALSGADFALAENAVPSTGFFQRSSTMLGKINASIDNAISQASNLTQRLQLNYPTAKDNLTTQLDYAKVIAYPDKYKVGSDGLVYEITK